MWFHYGFEEFKIIETIYTGKTLEQVSELKQSQDTLIKNEAEKALQAKIQLMSFIETAAEQKRSPEHADIKGIRENRKSEKRKQHENIGRKLRNG